MFFLELGTSSFFIYICDQWAVTGQGQWEEPCVSHSMVAAPRLVLHADLQLGLTYAQVPLWGRQ